MARFWVADLHLGHELVAEKRGFKSWQDHDEKLLVQLGKLTEKDHLWVLGDISSGREEKEEYALWKLKNTVKASMHLIAGNHDSVSSIHRNGFKKQREWLEVFDSIQQFGCIKFNGYQILMSHYPYARSGDGANRETVRYSEFRLPDTGLPLIHGHTHQDTPHGFHSTFDMDNGYRVNAPDIQQLCVSWDAHRRLVTEKDINTWTEKLKAQERGGLW